MAHRMRLRKKTAPRKNSVSVVLERRDDATWIARLGERPEVMAAGASVAQARKRLRAKIAREARDLADLPVRERIVLPERALQAIDDLVGARQALLAAEQESAAILIRGFGLPIHDASELLGIPDRKVVHLVGEVAYAEADRKYATRAAARTTRR